MSGIIVDRAVFYLQSQPAKLQPGDTFVSVILEVAASGFKVRVKSGKLKSTDPPLIEGKSKQQSQVFEIEENARLYFKEQIELLTQIGFQRTLPIHKQTA
jgi:hypothetical protein